MTLLHEVHWANKALMKQTPLVSRLVVIKTIFTIGDRRKSSKS